MADDSQETTLAAMDRRYDPEVCLMSRLARTPGYHTNIADGTPVHETRESADYAIACLRSDEPGRVERGTQVLEKLLSLQETDPLAPAFGIWSWFYEEPVAKMSPPDWNWADFIGARLLMILAESSSRLPQPLLQRLQQGIERAAWCIFRRQSPVGYTNIAIMGAGVCAAAGERLGRPILLEYGRNKLAAVARLATEVGCFNEYNSPAYTMVAIEECERILHLVHDQSTRALAQQLHAAAWQMVAEHWHQPTGQWAGPHGRAYSDRLMPATLHRIGRALGRELPGQAPDTESLDLVPVLPCPPESAAHFTLPLEHPRTVTMPLGTLVDGAKKVATTWLAPTCCLSSVSREHTWAQCRSVLAYWKANGETAVFKVQWLLDGRDMPGMRIATNQVQSRMLLALYPLYKSGPFHPHFSVPADHVHAAADLRLRFLVDGPGARAEQLGPTTFQLSCGDHAIRIIAAACDFGGEPVEWHVQQQDRLAVLDGVCIQKPTKVNFQSLQVRLAAALQLLRPGGNAASGEVTIHDSGEQRRIEWHGSGIEPLTVPIAAQPFGW